MSLPSSARRRWGLDGGGDVGFLDLGDVVLIVPGGIDAVRRRMLDAVTDEDWRAARHGFGDPELADE